MSQFNLQRAFAGGGPASKYFENQPGTIKHLGAPSLLQIALLNGRELGVDDDEFGLSLFNPPGDLIDFAAADKSCRFGICQGSDDRLGNGEINSLGKTHCLRQPRLSIAVGVGRRRTVAAFDMQHDGARRHRAFNLKICACYLL